MSAHHTPSAAAWHAAATWRHCADRVRDLDPGAALAPLERGLPGCAALDPVRALAIDYARRLGVWAELVAGQAHRLESSGSAGRPANAPHGEQPPRHVDLEAS